MSKQNETLWPYDTKIAIAAIPIVLIIFTIIFSLTEKYAGWPDTKSHNLLLFVAVAMSFVPLVLVFIDFISKRGAIIGFKGFNLDFSRIDLSRTTVIRKSFGLPDNIGISGQIISDSSPMHIISALKLATENEIVLLDIKDGNAWWVTRLLALSAGAVRSVSPKVLVFMGRKTNINGTFLGWSEPAEILESILSAKEIYRTTYQYSMRIAKQVALYGSNELIPSSPTGFILHANVSRFTSSEEYVKLGDAAFEQILLDQLAARSDPAYPPSNSLENPPDRLTLGRFTQLFEHCIYCDTIDLMWPKEKQMSSFLDSHAPYVALVRNGKYESMLKREEVERIILKELFMQSQKTDY